MKNLALKTILITEAKTGDGIDPNRIGFLFKFTFF